MSRKDFHLLLQRYVEGKSTAEEKDLIEQWYELLGDDELPAIQESELMQIESRLWDKIKPRVAEPAIIRPLYTKTWFKWSVAAAIVLCISLTFLWNDHSSRDNIYAAVPGFYKEQTNKSGKPVSVTLEDGTVITLENGSGIKYPEHFAAEKREVYLNGNAFFNVSKNPNRPFYVYSTKIVTHVLGTSFKITTSENGTISEVAVRTGRVEVYENTDAKDKSFSKKTNGVVLTPNQKVTYSKKENHFETSLVEAPVPVLTAKDSSSKIISFTFDDTPLAVVLSSISREYGIDIMVESDNLNNCPFTGEIKEQDLYTKLDIICQVIKASYEIKGTTILIRGKGCTP